jgi:hypothetical protein
MPQSSLHCAVCVALGDDRALVIRLLPARQSNLELGPSVLQVEPQGNDRATGSLQIAQYFPYLLLMEKEAPGPSGIMVGPAGGRIVGDMSAD